MFTEYIKFTPQDPAKLAISQYNDGLYQMSLATDFVPALGTSVVCSGTTDKAHRLEVLFGQDTTSYCTLYYTLADLRTNCATIRSQIYAIQTLTLASLTHVGKFGNASHLNIYDWVPIIKDVPATVTGQQVSLTRVSFLQKKLFYSTSHLTHYRPFWTLSLERAPLS